MSSLSFTSSERVINSSIFISRPSRAKRVYLTSFGHNMIGGSSPAVAPGEYYSVNGRGHGLTLAHRNIPLGR